MTRTLLTGKVIEIIKVKEFRGQKYYFTQNSRTGIPESQFKHEVKKKTYVKSNKVSNTKPADKQSVTNNNVQPSNAKQG